MGAWIYEVEEFFILCLELIFHIFAGLGQRYDHQ